VYQKTLPSVVFINSKGGSGSGFLIDRERRLVVTAYHVVANQTRVLVAFPVIKPDGTAVTKREHYLNQGGIFIEGRVNRRLKQKDLAVIQLDHLPSNAKAIIVANTQLKPGEKVYTVGNPGASSGLWVYSEGAVRAVTDDYQIELPDQVITADVIETQNPTNPGDSGGPVVNGRAELVGVTCGGRTDATLVSFCISASEVKSLLASFAP